MSLDVNGMVKLGAMEHTECILCGTCVDNCPNHAIEFSFSREVTPGSLVQLRPCTRKNTPKRKTGRILLILAGLILLALAIYQLPPVTSRLSGGLNMPSSTCAGIQPGGGSTHPGGKPTAAYGNPLRQPSALLATPTPGITPTPIAPTPTPLPLQVFYPPPA